MVVLQQQRGRLGVVLAGGDVQGRQPNLPLGVVLQQQGDHGVVALLESDGQWSEAILEEQRRGRPFKIKEEKKTPVNLNEMKGKCAY